VEIGGSNSPSRWLSRDEFARLIEAAAITPHLVVFLHLAIATAGRKEALLSMTWTQVNWDRDEVWLGFKPNGKHRPTVPMTSTLRAALQTARKIAVANNVVEFEGEPIKSIKRAFGSAVRRAGLGEWVDDPTAETAEDRRRFVTDVTPHAVRHTAAVWMVGDGVDMAKVSRSLGHSDTRVTERVYARYQPDHLRDAAAALEL
jgi:integrase